MKYMTGLVCTILLAITAVNCSNSGGSDDAPEETAVPATTTVQGRTSGQQNILDVRLLSADLVSVQVELDTETGAGIFQILIECRNPVTDLRCSGVSLENLRGGVINRPGPQEKTQFLCNESAGFDRASDDITVLQPEEESLTNGGIRINGPKGPAPVYAPENSQLSLALADQTGCRWFDFNVTP